MRSWRAACSSLSSQRFFSELSESKGVKGDPRLLVHLELTQAPGEQAPAAFATGGGRRARWRDGPVAAHTVSV